MKYTTSILLAVGFLVGPTHAATIFLTNNSTKTLLANQGDAAILEGAEAGDTRILTLSADDGNATIGMEFLRIQSNIASDTGNSPIGMDADSMGVGNDKWGDPSQGFEFSFDQSIDFLGTSFIVGSTGITLSSTAWGSDTTGQSGGSGANAWTFSSDGTTGTFSWAGAGTYDFSTGTFSTVAADTPMLMRRNTGGASGVGMSSFTIAVIPEPSSVALLAIAGGALLLRRRRM